MRSENKIFAVSSGSQSYSLNDAPAEMQYSALSLIGSRCYLNYTFNAVHSLAILASGILQRSFFSSCTILRQCYIYLVVEHMAENF